MAIQENMKSFRSNLVYAATVTGQHQIYDDQEMDLQPLDILEVASDAINRNAERYRLEALDLHQPSVQKRTQNSLDYLDLANYQTDITQKTTIAPVSIRSKIWNCVKGAFKAIGDFFKAVFCFCCRGTKALNLEDAVDKPKEAIGRKEIERSARLEGELEAARVEEIQSTQI
jgi:protein tyrosine phosphatase (PTP) superfamily phosphohydrolase (DUF442 family)